MTLADYQAARSSARAALIAAVEADAKQTAAKAATARQLGEAVRVAFAAGVAPKDIVTATGLSRTRVYELRDGR